MLFPEVFFNIFLQMKNQEVKVFLQKIHSSDSLPLLITYTTPVIQPGFWKKRGKIPSRNSVNRMHT